MFIAFKILVSATIIAIVSEIAKKDTSMGGFLAAMPLTTLLTMIWLYIDKRDVVLIGSFTRSVFWAIIPSMLFFIPPMILYKRGWNFFLVLGISFFLLWIGYLLHHKYMT